MNDTSKYCATPNRNTSRKRLEPLKDVSHSLGFKDAEGRTVKRLIREGKLKAVRIGNRIMVSTESIDAFVASGGLEG